MNIPYCFVRGRADLGALVHQKNATCVALTEVRKEDETELNNLATAFRTHFNDNKESRRLIGGFKKGTKSQVKFDRVQAVK
jgi:large subunit ribosomal protein L7Ae